ncbi:MAG: T9SS type A sorting domain-containing protein [Bacteroidota bacterium]
MKKKFILLPLVALFVYLVMAGNAAGPGTGSGVDATVGGCTTGSCHGGAATASTTVAFQLYSGATPVATYVPGGSYTIRLTGTQTSGSFSLPRFGYQLKAVNSGGTNAGTLTAPSGSHTLSLGGVTFVEHGPGSIAATTGSGGAGTTYVVDIPWTAPASGTGLVTVRGALNAVNNNGAGDAGDKWNTGTITFTELLATSTTGTSICIGATTTLTNTTTGGGTWAASNTNVSLGAATGSSVIVTGLAAGTSVITYTAGASTTTTTITVNPNPSITGTASVCAGATTTLAGSIAGGTFASSDGSIATVGVSNGVVTGASAGTATITYTLSTGCTNVRTVTVNGVPPIVGAGSLCVGNSATLTNSTSGGTWSSTNGAVATIGASSGVLSAISAGTATISYLLPSGCATTAVVTVNANPAGITGTLSVCAGSSTSLASATAGGTWNTSNGSIATIGPSSGVAAGVAAGTATISYSLSTGCLTTSVISVNASPAAITGSAAICTGVSTTLASTSTGGTWTSSNTSVATAGASSGIVTGAGVGTAAITYTLPGGCFATRVVTVNSAPGAVMGSLAVCLTTTSTLSNSSTGGTWVSDNTAIALIGSSSGLVSPVAAGTANVTYSLAAGCVATAVVTVNPLPAVIGGTQSVCVGATTTLSNTSPGGTWASSTGNATISAGGVVSGITAGTSMITYTLPTGCIRTAAVTVNGTPSAITGTPAFCVGATTTLASTTGGGTWSSTNTAVATIGSTSGIATGMAAGTVTISYIVTATGCFTTTVVTVNALPAAISGSSAVCVGSAITLSNATTGGTWSGSNANVTVGAGGDITGVTAGTVTITYMLSTGCMATTVLTVNPLPAALVTGGTVCVGATSSILAPTGGGTWSSSATSVASVSSAGVVTGNTAGTATITYALPTGCARTTVMTVNSLPAANTGSATVCAGSTTTLSNTTGGGTWTSGSTSVASVDMGSGVVTGVASGTSRISYILPTGCAASTIVTVNPLPNAGVISGPVSVCVGNTAALSNAATGGTWSSSSTAIATVSSSGVVTGMSAGLVTITYTASNSCGTAIATKSMTVTITASAGVISGSTAICVGVPSTLSSTAGGGTWTSSNTAVASVTSATGIITGMTSGTATISYSVTGSCGSATATTVVTVSPAPAAISGPSTVCLGSGVALSNTGGGTWMSSDAGVATVGSSTGVVTGIATGTVIITYTLPGGCQTTRSMTVNPVPTIVTGTFNTCLGTTVTLANATPGGTFSSTNTAVASIGATSGVVTGMLSGTTTISYTIPSGCAATAIMTIDVTPAPVTGITHVCAGNSTTLANGTPGGTWSSSDLVVASAAMGTGVITGVSAGTSTISYVLPTGCFRNITLTVDPLPGAIAGSTVVCEGASVTVSNPDGGGTWSTSATTVASVGSASGILSGVAAGTATLTYTLPTGCIALRTVTVNLSPAAITGSPSICLGSATTLGNVTIGGTWSSTNPAVAVVVSTSGVVAPVSLGTATISYTISSGCSRTLAATVNAVPPAIGGASSVCVGQSVTLTNAIGGGVWTTASSGVAVTATLGSVLGITPGTSMVTYTLPTGCLTTITLPVNVSPSAIIGGPGICEGSTATLSNTVIGGTWASSNTAIAPVGTVSGIVVGTALGTSAITYTLPTGCMAMLTLSVNAVPAAITGTASICPGTTTTLGSATVGGSWSSSAGSIATVGSTGIVSGLTPGVATITYAMPWGCSAILPVTVNALPVAGTITGLTSVCAGASITLTDPVPGGVWSVSNASATITAGSGILTGVAGGLDTIRYSVTNACGTATATYWVVVNPLPNPGTISGVMSVCAGVTSLLSNSAGGGTWSVSNANATISGAGMITGVSAGTATVSYTVSNVCGSAVSTALITVMPAANAGFITGPDTVCQGDAIHLESSGTGGVWIASNTNATVVAGHVVGVHGGLVDIMYIVMNSCSVDTSSRRVYVKSPEECFLQVDPAVVSNGSLSIYPNPASGSFIVELPVGIVSGEIVVSDVTGKTISSVSVQGSNGNKVVFNIPDIASGTYFVRVDTAGKVYREKIVIIK